jgi:sec-independent protein translocase protein TatA
MEVRPFRANKLLKAISDKKNVLILPFQFKMTAMNLNILLFAFGPMEIILVIAVIILLFGGKKIPELMKGIGQGMKEFKKASKVNEEDEKVEKN